MRGVDLYGRADRRRRGRRLLSRRPQRRGRPEGKACSGSSVRGREKVAGAGLGAETPRTHPLKNRIKLRIREEGGRKEEGAGEKGPEVGGSWQGLQAAGRTGPQSAGRDLYPQASARRWRGGDPAEREAGDPQP